jgi:hypothetical protein
VFGANADLPFWQLTTRKFTAQSYDPKTNSWTVCASIPTGRYSASVAVVDDLLYVIGGFTIEFPTDGFHANPSYTYSTVNEQYTPFGFGTPTEPEQLERPSSQQPAGFLGSSLPMEYGYAIVSVILVTIAVATNYLYYKRRK